VARTISADADDTRSRLLKAAAEIFAEKGYENATIREICGRASANVALVNYHFGDKLELYTEVWRCFLKRGEQAAAAASEVDPEMDLRNIVRAMLERAFETREQDHLRIRMMLHEFVQPTPATARVVEVAMRPVYDRLRNVVGALLDLAPDDEQVRLSVHSIIGQVTHFAHSGPMMAALWPEMKMTPEQRARVAAHIAEVALSSLEFRRKRKPI
jgi:AcrR family transcriptional regulator